MLAAPTLAAIPNVEALLGAPLPIALQGADADGDALVYTVTSGDANRLEVLTTAAANRTLKITMDGFGAGGSDGQIWLHLFEDRAPLTTAKIIALAQQNAYDGKTFHRIIEDFMIQGGGSGTGKQIDDEFHPDLQFTRDGVLAMANAGDDTGENQFFITDAATRWLDFNHTVFGFLTAGDDVRKAVQAAGETQRIQLNGNSSSGTWRITFNGATTAALPFNATAAQVETALKDLSSIGGAAVGGTVSVASSAPRVYTVKFGSGLSTSDVPMMTVNTTALSPATTASVTEVSKGFAPVMKQVRVVDDKQRDVILLKLKSMPSGSGTIPVTVKVSDGHGGSATRVFQVTAKADTSNSPPFVVTPSDFVKTPLNTPVTCQIRATDVENDAIVYDAALKTPNANITVAVNRDTGLVTITPRNNVEGVFELILKAGRTESGQTTWDTQSTALCIGPPAPTAITLLNPDTKRDPDVTLADNASGSNALRFQVTGLRAGTKVSILIDGNELGSVTATGTSMVVSTNGQKRLAPGAHRVTARQTALNQAVKVGNTDTTANVAGLDSAPITTYVETTTSGTSTPAIYDPKHSLFRLRNTNTSGVEDKYVAYGEVSSAQPWRPVIGDWNGDGVETIGLYNPANAAFYLKNSNQSGHADALYAFGTPGNNWIPIAGDWDGDGIDTWGLYDPATSTFYLRNSRASGIAEVTFVFGQPGSMPIAGNWDGTDKIDTVGVYRPGGEHFLLRNSNTAGAADVDFVFASSTASGNGTLPLAGDWNADGKDTIGVYNTTKNELRFKNANSTSASATTISYGYQGTGIVPLGGDWDGGSGSGSALMAAEANPAALDDDLLDLLAGSH